MASWLLRVWLVDRRFHIASMIVSSHGDRIHTIIIKTDKRIEANSLAITIFDGRWMLLWCAFASERPKFQVSGNTWRRHEICCTHKKPNLAAKVTRNASVEAIIRPATCDVTTAAASPYPFHRHLFGNASFRLTR